MSKQQLEKCVLNLNILKRLSSKNEIICNSSLKNIINEIIPDPLIATAGQSIYSLEIYSIST